MAFRLKCSKVQRFIFCLGDRDMASQTVTTTLKPHGAASRAYDYAYDNTYTVASSRDLARAEQRVLPSSIVR